MLAQYFYPQRQTKVMNEGCATFVPLRDHEPLYDKGLITEGSMLEFMHSHSSVVFQPRFEDRFYSGINPYALGFAMMRDIQRMCLEPTEEDRAVVPRVRRQRRSDGHAEGGLGRTSATTASSSSTCRRR